MSRYIDADAVLDLIQEQFHKTDANGAEQIGVLTCHRIVRTAPTADVVEVVRCKDCLYCRYVNNADIYRCDRRGYYSEEVKSYGYCSYGERKENGT